MRPKQIKAADSKLNITWNNNSSTSIQLKYLRDECPCAGCKGETILLRTYRPPKLTMMQPGMYEIKEIKLVGGYAIQINWKDGHDTGIYSWEYLLQLDKDQESNSQQKYDTLL
ncbi:MAG: DUF971 domain-containing protein [Ignavibacteria bacterium]|jgi:DUF971 family protein|nr:DUF971 domain-containing protein [Ignavibacteria bacterium]